MNFRLPELVHNRSLKLSMDATKNTMLTKLITAGSLLAIASGCANLPQGFPSRVAAEVESPARLFVDDLDTDTVPVAAPRVASGPEKPGLKIRKSKRGNMESYVVRGQRYYTLDTAEEYSARGTASWYGPNFHGRTASNGEVYDMYRMTAAHKTLPLPTYARVTHLDNGRSVVVKINDRGPFSGDRIIDLSFAAALRLGMINDGTGEVEVKTLSPEEVMVLSGPENKFDVDFYYAGEENQETLADVAGDSAEADSISVAAVSLDTNPIQVKAITGQSAALGATAIAAAAKNSTAAGSSQNPSNDDLLNDDLLNDDILDDKTRAEITAANVAADTDEQIADAIVPAVADVNVQGLVPVPAAVQSVAAPDATQLKDATDDSGYYIQAGVYARISDAERIAVDAVLAADGEEEVHVKPLKGSDLYRVTLGPIASSERAGIVSGQLTEAGLDNFTVRVE